MSCTRWLYVLMLTGVAAVSVAGDIQISCEPGLRVFIDGELMGTSNAREDGLYVLDVANGEHTVRVEKDGCLPQSFEVDLAHLPIEVKVGEFRSELPPTAGILVVTSAPQNCVVEIDGRSETKTAPHLSIEGLDPGEHQIAFTKPNFDRVSGVVTIAPGGETTVRGNLIAGKVEVLRSSSSAAPRSTPTPIRIVLPTTVDPMPTAAATEPPAAASPPPTLAPIRIRPQAKPTPTPMLELPQVETLGKGSLRLTTKPQKCLVRFAGKNIEKSDMILKRALIPAGEYPLVVVWRGKVLSTRVVISDHIRTIVAVSFFPKDKPFVISYEAE